MSENLNGVWIGISLPLDLSRKSEPLRSRLDEAREATNVLVSCPFLGRDPADLTRIA